MAPDRIEQGFFGGASDSIAGRLAEVPALEPVRRALLRAGVRQAWLVGGALRDLAYGKSEDPRDLDVALPGSGAEAAAEAARELRGTAFPLNEGEGAWRVVWAGGQTVDLVALRAPDLEADLRGRDFTINALSFDLLGAGGLADPLGGMLDLRRRCLRLCSRGALEEDPVRVLRAYRFAFGLGLSMEEGLAGSLAAVAARLSEVAPERVRTELFAVLALPRGARALRAMEEHGVLTGLFPFLSQWRGFDQGDYHAHDLLEHSLRAAEAVEDLVEEPADLPRPTDLKGHLEGELEAGISRLALLKCAAFFHDIAKPATVSLDGARRRFLSHEVQGGRQLRRLLQALRVGRRARSAAQQIVEAHLRLFSLAHQQPPTKSARLRYLRDLKDEAPEALLLSLADEIATGPTPRCLPAAMRTARELLELYWERRGKEEIAPLLRGRDLLEALGLPPGPAVGELLRRVGEAEKEGTVSSREEALALARELAVRG